MPTLKLITIGTSTGIVIPKGMLARMKVKNGDSLYAVETKDGFLLTQYDPSIEEQMHEESLAELGGPRGMRAEGLPDSAPSLTRGNDARQLAATGSAAPPSVRPRAW